jgi:orotate phosphoribosyltransferase-like protein
VIIDVENWLAHYGTPRRSGRYPYGSGGEDGAKKRNPSFLDDVAEMRKKGFTQKQIADSFDMTTSQLRAAQSIEVNQQRQRNITQAQRLKDTGMSNMAIAREMKAPESSVRAWLAPGAKDKADILTTVSDMLRIRVDEDGYIDIGEGVENWHGISGTRLKNAVAILEAEGYKVHPVQVDQLPNPRNKTTIKVLTRPGTTYADAKANRDKIKQVNQFSEDGGRTLLNIHPPMSVDPKRIKIVYDEDGGGNADGVMHVRRGVEDVSIGPNAYAQVRVKVGDTHYLKGMAVYKDDLPAGTDIVFHTNKNNTGNKLDAMKKLSDDEDNPFGSVVRQIVKTDAHGNERLTSAMNIVGYKPGSGEEGAWEGWSRNLAPQLLSKQSPRLAQKQLDLTYESKKNEFDEIMRLTNPAVKKKLLEGLADSADSSAVHLKAAKIPGQATHVIMPIQSMKPHEVYAPNYNNGDMVALVRFPHAGTFEIPELKVNNSNKEAKALLGEKARDAVGIHPSVAHKLSGADFDGDFVVVIPNNNKQIKSTPSLEKLKDFDPRVYKLPDDAPKMTSKVKGQQMGLVSNLITDMTIKGASPDEMARAVKHSMVVIDAEKHHLDYKQSAKDNGIKALYVKYQDGKPSGGGSTIISRAKGRIDVPDRQLRRPAHGGPIDPKTGKLVYEDQPKTFVDRHGNTVVKTKTSKKLAETDDAFTLVSKDPARIEIIYAEHSNRMKQLANDARKEYVKIKPPLVLPSAKKTYAPEVESLKAKLELSRRNKPLERQAQVFANAVVNQKKAANPGMDAATLKKIQTQAIEAQRLRLKSQRQKIVPTEREWQAIQAGAISNHQLTQILQNTDMEVIKTLATPRTKVLMSSTKTARAREMANAGYTQAEIASHLGVSVSTLKSALYE